MCQPNIQYRNCVVFCPFAFFYCLLFYIFTLLLSFIAAIVCILRITGNRLVLALYQPLAILVPPSYITGNRLVLA